MKKRVVVTGLGAITPIGNNVEEFWNGIKSRIIMFQVSRESTLQDLNS